jgi:hypothetical protein
MPYYYVNKNAQPTGEHEIQTTSCNQSVTIEANKLSLGYHTDCNGAKQEALYQC